MTDADARILAAVRMLRDLSAKPDRLIGVALADLRVVLGESGGGLAVCGHGTAAGPGGATKAADAAIADLRDQLAALRRP